MISFPCFFVSLAFNSNSIAPGIIFVVFNLIDKILEFPGTFILNAYSSMSYKILGAMLNYFFYAMVIEMSSLLIKKK